MKRLMTLWAALCLLVGLSLPVTAHADYPETLGDGKYVLVAARQGMGWYADRTSAAVHQYAPPNYTIAIQVITADFNTDGYHYDHINQNSPSRLRGTRTFTFRYHWHTKQLSYAVDGSNRWSSWNYDSPEDNTVAGGYSEIPFAAEVAFYEAYRMAFFGDTTNSGGFRVIPAEATLLYGK